jgi:integrase
VACRAVWDNTWELVFTTPVGRPLSGTWVPHAFQGHLATAGLPRQRFYDLRHACASLLIAMGLHPREIMEILGHSHISLTMNTYGHVMKASLRRGAEKMDQFLRTGEVGEARLQGG